MTNKKIRIVVAKYNEDLTWTRLRNNYNVDITVYDKSDDNLKDINDFVKVNDFYFKLPNIGREAHTYIKHIVENYDNLYDIEVFAQGRPFDHVPDFWQKVDLLTDDTDFVDFSPSRKISCLNENSYLKVSNQHPNIDINDRGSGSYIFLASDGHKKLYELIHGEINGGEDEFIEYGLHAMFAVSSERIKKTPLDTYKKMLELFSMEKHEWPAYGYEHIYWAYEFEYAWKYIFSDKL